MLFHWSLNSYLEYGELPLYVNTVLPGEQPENQLHDHGESVELVLVAGGEAIHWETPYHARICKGDILLIHPEVIHGYQNSETLKLKNITFRPRHLSLPLMDTSSMPFFRMLFSPGDRIATEKQVEPLMHLNETDFSRINSIFDRLQQELSGILPGRQFIALALFMELLTELARLFSPETDSAKPLWLIGDAMAYMQKNYTRAITMQQVARASGISRRNLFRYFKNRLNCTPLEYLTRLRLQKVLELILQSDLSLGEIALRCGFCDSNYLSKQFSAEYGIPPGKFRKLQLKNRSDQF